jgi:flavin reductase (DIM6/NTAB) family NADH-FMN oxidoreductase RutF/uncharacterized protein YciI
VRAPGKVPFDVDKATWHPSVLPGQVVLVTTVDEDGQPNLAPKSWVTMAAFGGPILAFGCTERHRTLRNAEATREFVVNVPSEALAERTWALVEWHGQERIERSGLTLVPAERVAPPLVAECKAHLECRLQDVKRFREEAFVFGRIVAASIDGDCLAGQTPDQYFSLRPFFFLEAGTYGSIDTAKRVGATPPAEQQLFMVELSDVSAAATEAHAGYLGELNRQGWLLLAGSYEYGVGPSRMYVVHADSAEQAEALARADPLVRAGAGYAVRSWRRTF